MKNQSFKEEIKRIDSIILVLLCAIVAFIIIDIVIGVILIQNYLDYGTF